MRIIIAPAKKMVVDTDSFAVDSLPQFLEQTERLKAVLQSMSPQDLQALWKCNDSIAKLNIERLGQMDLRRNLTPAILSYEGIQYRYMAPGVMETAHLDYLQEHLRILSGFYGLLRPFDGVTPYRLEMQAKLAVDGICIRLDLKDARQLTVMLWRCSDNLNQYAKRANETGSIYAADIEDLQKRLDEIWELSRQTLASLAEIR